MKILIEIESAEEEDNGCEGCYFQSIDDCGLFDLDIDNPLRMSIMKHCAGYKIFVLKSMVIK